MIRVLSVDDHAPRNRSAGFLLYWLLAAVGWLRDDPEFAATVGRHDYDDRWTDRSATGRTQRRAHLSGDWSN